MSQEGPPREILKIYYTDDDYEETKDLTCEQVRCVCVCVCKPSHSQTQHLDGHINKASSLRHQAHEANPRTRSTHPSTATHVHAKQRPTCVSYYTRPGGELRKTNLLKL